MIKQKVIQVRLTKENIAYFKALNYIDERNGNITSKGKDISLNKLINLVISQSFKHGLEGNLIDSELLLAKFKRVMIKDLIEQRKALEDEMQRINKI